MNLINTIVCHKSLGTGTVTECDGNYITVTFCDKSHQFVYPSAFAADLTAQDPQLQAQLQKLIDRESLLPASSASESRHTGNSVADTDDNTPVKTYEDFAAHEITRLKRLCRTMPALSKASRCLNICALENKLPKTFCREDEINQIKQILLRRFKANILLTGTPGVGKTAVVEGFAQHLVNLRWAKYSEEKQLPCDSLFQRLVIFELSMNALVAGTKYRGEFEEKLQKILEEVQTHHNVILYIDEIHQSLYAGCTAEGTSSFCSILKPALARNDIRIIGSTTSEEVDALYRDKALSRRFTDVTVHPLEGDKAVLCLSQILPDYADHFQIRLGQSITALDLYNKVMYFFPETVFPNNVIDIIDQTFANAKFAGKKEITMCDINQTLSALTGLVIM